VTTLSARLGSRTSNAWGVGRGTWTKSRLELELLVAPLEAVATFEDVEGLFVMVVPMQGHTPPSVGVCVRSELADHQRISERAHQPP
jgi:hypothetical protein